MAWIEFHDTLPHHPKTWALCDALKIERPHAVGLMACLWTWAITHAVDGDLSKFPDRAIATAAGWEKKPDQFVSALIDAGFLDGDHYIHDWDQYAGRMIEIDEARRDSDRSRQRKRREKLKAARDASHECHEDVTRDITVESQQNPLTTVPDLDLTIPDLKELEEDAHAPEGEKPEDEIGLPIAPQGAPEVARVVALYESEITPHHNQTQMDAILHFFDVFPPEAAEHIITYAIREAAKSNDTRNAGYIEGILGKLQAEGIATVAALDDRKLRHEQAKLRGGNVSAAHPRSPTGQFQGKRVSAQQYEQREYSDEDLNRLAMDLSALGT